MEIELVKAIATISGAGLSGVFAAYFTMRSRLNEIKKAAEIVREKQKEEDKERLKEEYLDPLRVSAQVFLDRLEHINSYIQKYRNNRDSDNLFFDTIEQLQANYANILPEGVSYQLWENDTERFKWANNYGHLVISTLRITSLYFYHANRVLEKVPYLELTPNYDSELRRYIINVGKSLGGPFGIWEDLHDSLGKYMMQKDGNVMNYRDFCRNEILHKTNYVWFTRVIEFYSDIPKKTIPEIDGMINSLKELCEFLKRKTYDITNSSKDNKKIKPK